MRAWIGTSGWHYYDWKGKFYSEDLPSKDWLSYFVQKFETVEINTSFYHFTKPKTFLKWKTIIQQTKVKKFLFALKLHRLFTHIRRLNLQKEDERILQETLTSYTLLGKYLGPILIQLPPSFKKDLDRLEKFLQIFRKIAGKKRFLLAIEFRHRSWLEKEVYQFLKKKKIAFVISDSPKWPTEIVKTDDFVYLRFHGRPQIFRSQYSKDYLKDYIKKIKKLKPKTLFVYFNNDVGGAAVVNAKEFQDLINESFIMKR